MPMISIDKRKMEVPDMQEIENITIICNKKEAHSCEFASFLYLLSVSNYSETTSKGISTDTSLWNLIVAL